MTRRMSERSEFGASGRLRASQGTRRSAPGAFVGTGGFAYFCRVKSRSLKHAKRAAKWS
jgi:hypothetical protein